MAGLIRAARAIVKKAAPDMIALLLVAFSLSGCFSGAITVNGGTIDTGILESEAQRRVSIVKKNNPKELEGERGDRFIEETRKRVATELIRETILEQQARSLGVQASEDEVSRRIEEERASKGAERFEKNLASQGLDEVAYRGLIRNEVLVEKLGGKVAEGVRVTEDEAESFYLTNRELFGRSEMVHVQHILLETEGQARMVAEQAKRGDDFSMLARSLSRDIVSRENGGDLGWIERGTMDPDFEAAAFSLPVGGVSDAVRASDGYHVMKVLERRDAYAPPFEEVKSKVMQTLLNRKKEELFSDWLRTAYANAVVRLPRGLGNWDPALGQVIADRG